MTAFARRRGLWAAVLAALIATAGAGAFYAEAGLYYFNALLPRGGPVWDAVPPDSPRLSPSMRLALRDPPPAGRPGPLAWQAVEEGFEAAEPPVLVDGAEGTRLLPWRWGRHGLAALPIMLAMVRR